MKRRADAPGGPITGVLVVDKPSGMTSHDVVAQVRRALRTRRVGHAGTLDPMATGVLVLLVGEATKLSSVLTTQSKEYEARIVLGTETDSLDADGRIVGRRAIPADWRAGPALELALSAERERTLQIPPVVSAIRVDGQRSYRLARAGQSVEHEPRPVQVHELTVERLGEATLDVRLRVSKGYYVRALARDLAQALGTVGHLSALRRVRSGAFSIEQAVPLPLANSPPLLSLAEAVRVALPCIQVDSSTAQALRQGKAICREGLPPILPSAADGVVAALHGVRLIALVELSEDSDFFIVRRGILDGPPGENPEGEPILDGDRVPVPSSDHPARSK